MDSAQVNVQVSFNFKAGETNVTSENFILRFSMLLFHVGQRASVVWEAGVAQQTTGLAIFLSQTWSNTAWNLNKMAVASLKHVEV